MAISTVAVTLSLVLYPLLYWNNAKIRFWSKIVFFRMYVLFLVPTLFLPFALLRPRDVRNYSFIMLTVRLLARVFDVKWTIKGLENVKKEDSVVITCNHQSTLDLIAMGALWPVLGRTTSVMKRELLYTGPFGITSYLCGSVYVDRSNSASAKASLNNAVECLTSKKTKIWMFPEGTLNKAPTMLPFKKGAFHMAVQAQVPILPIVVSSYSSFYSVKERKFDRGGHLTITILPPIPTKGLTTNDIDMLITAVRLPMQETINTMAGRKDEIFKSPNGAQYIAHAT